MLGKKPPPLVDTKPIRRQSTMVNGKEGPPKLFRGWGVGKTRNPCPCGAIG
uniref:Uncharacterized protein n=1 Tax=viral metagenome TaxID=1070528 RepID=A0A6C0LTS2_9ZZZZ